MRMLFVGLYRLLCLPVALSLIVNTKVPQQTITSQFPSNEDLRSIVDAINDGHSGDSAMLVNLQESHSINYPILSLHSESRVLSLRLKPSHGLLRSSTRLRIIEGENELEQNINPELRSAFYHGKVEGDEMSSVSLARTSRGWTGLVATEGERYILHGVPGSTDSQYLLLRMEDEGYRRSYSSKVSKMSSIREETYNMTGYESISRDVDPDFEFEIGVYADDELIKYVEKKYPNADPIDMVQEVLLITMNTVHTNYQKASMGKTVSIIITELNIMKQIPKGLKKTKKMEDYLDNFCDWEATERNPGGTKYDFGLLFSGWDMYGDHPSETEVLGMSPLEAACLYNIKRSCAIGEATGYGVGLIMTHEIGHNLGMDHDSDGNSCRGEGWIMGAYISPGATQFSKCSRSYLDKYLQALDDFGINCLRDNGKEAVEHAVEDKLPGERLKKGEQCRYALGDGWSEYYDDKDFCKELMCKNGQDIESGNYGGPPMPGTWCAENKVCYNAKCQDRDAVIKAINGLKSTSGRRAGKVLPLDNLCKKYGSKKYPKGVTYKKYRRRKGVKQYLYMMCDEGMLCANKKGRALQLLAYPAPPGTNCGKGKTCKNFKCQK